MLYEHLFRRFMMGKSYTKNNLARRISIVILLTVISVMMLLPQSAMTALAATAGTNKIQQANSVKVARASRKKTNLKTPGTVKRVSFSKNGRIVYVSWNRPAKTSGSALYKVYYKIGSRSWKTRLTSSATVRIDVGYHQVLKVKIRTYNRRGSTKKAGAVSSVFKTVTASAGNSGSQDNASDTSEENMHSQTPGVPSGISMEGSSDGTVTVSWGEPPEDVTSYELSYKIGDDDWQTADVDIHGEYTLQTGYDKTVLVKVRALNGDRAGSWSAVKSYYMKPEYGYYDIGTDSVTVKIGESKTIPCKYVEGWKGKKAGSRFEGANSIVYLKDGLLHITGKQASVGKYILYEENESGKQAHTIVIRVIDPVLDAELEAKVDKIKDEMGIKDSMSDLMKAKLVAEWECRHFSYSRNGSADVKYTLLTDNPATLCAGYARAYNYILTQLGVPVRNISYMAGDHEWNQVEINGYWYNVDVTWMDDDQKVNNGVRQWDEFMTSYTKMVSMDKFWEKSPHAYYNDPNLVQYRSDDTKYDNYDWANYTE